MKKPHIRPDRTFFGKREWIATYGVYNATGPTPTRALQHLEHYYNLCQRYGHKCNHDFKYESTSIDGEQLYRCIHCKTHRFTQRPSRA